jgi:tetratricopeptide (TPR) repeat protein
MRKSLYPVLIAVTGILFLVIVLFSKKEKPWTPSLKERTGVLSQSPDWITAKQQMQSLIAAIETNPKDNNAKQQLAQLFIEESRITNEHAFYDSQCILLLDDVLKTDSLNVDILCNKATVLLSQHHFSEALMVAEKAKKISPYTASVYGLLCDANLELGRYNIAIEMADKMVSVRPDIRSYSRVSYLREIFGDYSGAITAMKLAVSAGYPGLEQTEWSRIILAHLYESVGQLDSASFQYAIALQERPDYAFAIAGLGRIEKAKGNYKEAITYYEKASSIITEFSFQDELTDLYRLANQIDKANTSAQKVIALLGPGNADESVTGHGHYADKELAYAYLKTNQLDSALAHAKTEYDRRPENIDINETMAWVLYKKGSFKEAETYMNKAMRTNSSNPVLLCRAGLIQIKNGKKDSGSLLIQKALQQNPFLDPDLKKEAAPYAIAQPAA